MQRECRFCGQQVDSDDEDDICPSCADEVLWCQGCGGVVHPGYDDTHYVSGSWAGEFQCDGCRAERRHQARQRSLQFPFFDARRELYLRSHNDHTDCIHRKEM